MRQNFPYTDGDRPIFFVHAIRYLAAAQKDRTSDNLKNIVKTEFAYGRKPDIPDFALDMHTEKGRALGRDFKHFLAEGSRVENELPVDQNYKSRLLDLLDKMASQQYAGDNTEGILKLAVLDRNKISLDHRLNEKGLELSGGEKQRINLARAIYLSDGFLVLDEPLTNVQRTLELLTQHLSLSTGTNK